MSTEQKLWMIRVAMLGVGSAINAVLSTADRVRLVYARLERANARLIVAQGYLVLLHDALHRAATTDDVTSNVTSFRH